MKSTHFSKGHQSAKGKIFSHGPYESAFSSFDFAEKWKDFLKDRLQEIETAFQQRRNANMPSKDEPLTINDKFMAYDLHKRAMERFFSSFKGYNPRKFISLTTCYGCLMEVPEHPLQCGHVLCTGCIKIYGHQHDSHSMLMDYCPLHSSQYFDKPWIIHFKPDYAGVRILSLDGYALSLRLSPLLTNFDQRWNAWYFRAGSTSSYRACSWWQNPNPSLLRPDSWHKVRFDSKVKQTLADFFSTGGLIALGLGVKQWSVNHCVTEFVRLCDQAFTPRELNNIFALEQAATLSHGSKYRTTPLRQALRTAFGNDLLYGGRPKAHLSYSTQVAVTATTGTGETGVVLANYSRHEESESSYKFEFPHSLQIWEAAAATSAAPSFFKSFRTESYPQKTYLDGAMYHNNPASVANHERKFLWPDVADNPPDILLSLGTGKFGQQMEQQMAELAPQPVKSQQTTRSSNAGLAAKSSRRTKPRRKRAKTSKFINKFFSVLVSQACSSGSWFSILLKFMMSDQPDR